ncbi:MAG TPA: hypothetical protein VJ596_07010 [Gemmatimonadaceae bacterium]|nr:hypothetical protein [Gemmatimonadaceae bacterium]
MDPRDVIAEWSTAWRSALPARTPAERAELLEETRQVIARLQEAARTDGRAGHALHRKTILQSASATFEVAATVPRPLQVGPFTPEAIWPATLRFSSAFPVARIDGIADQRGLAVRIVDAPRRLDLLATTGEAHHARDASAMLASLRAATLASKGGIPARLGALSTLVRALGVRDGLRMARTVSRAAEAGVSIAMMTFYSRAPFRLANFAVRYRFAAPVGVRETVQGSGGDALVADLRQRLREGPLRWSFDLQGYLDPQRTPMDDHRVPWRSPWITIATLVVHREGHASEAPAFRAATGWVPTGLDGAVMEPLGDLNMLRGVAYEVSQRGRGAAT